MPWQHLSAVALALLLGMPAASAASPFPEDCGCVWQQEYKSLHSAIKHGRHTQRYTAVSYKDMGETWTRTQGAINELAWLYADVELKYIKARRPERPDVSFAEPPRVPAPCSAY